MKNQEKRQRDKILRQFYELNKDKISKEDFIRIFNNPVSIPTLYRIMKNEKANK